MTDNKWAGALVNIQKHILLIKTPNGFGTGFFIARSNNNKIAIATALHVIKKAHEWLQPIKLLDFQGKDILLTPEKRSINLNSQSDLALIVLDSNLLPSLPQSPLSFIAKTQRLLAGIEVGWYGYPCITDKLCFFKGTISAWVQNRLYYFVDGVIINGTSGSPAFYISEQNLVILVGLVTAYIPNVQLGNTLPGLGIIRSIHPYITLFEEHNRRSLASRKHS